MTNALGQTGLPKGRAVILLYHRVGSVGRDPWALTVAPERFADHLSVLVELGEPAHLTRAIDTGSPANPSVPSVVVTFDDGYADCLLHAVPELEARGVPATFFVPTGAVDDEREFWWDELDRLVFRSSGLPESVSLAIDGRTFTWRLDNLGNDDARQGASPWHAWEFAAPYSREALYATLWQMLRPLDPRHRDDVIEQFRRLVGQNAVARPGYRTMSSSQVRDLASSGQFEIGGHSVTHAWLAGQSETEQRHEVVESRRILEPLVDRPVTTFAYPYGKPSDYTARTVEFVREAGYVAACANVDGIVRSTTDRLQLPRMFVQNWDREEFRSRLTRVLTGPDPTPPSQVVAE